MNRINWNNHIENQKHSGLSVASYCRQQKLSPSGFYTARKSFNKQPTFTPVLIKEEEKTTHFKLTVIAKADGMVEFSGLTSNYSFLSDFFARAVV